METRGTGHIGLHIQIKQVVMALRILSAIYSNWGFGIYELCRRFALQTQFFDLLTVEVAYPILKDNPVLNLDAETYEIIWNM
ncbi:hypothetical protein, partial [Providencia huaxiensis]|uniref:hypothetical protein n=1 Tax=Providencia huaxiensis TaxID=2027290 RepID=UPI0032DAC760